jgi:hypothetical protein
VDAEGEPDAADQEQQQPVESEQAHNALIAQMLSTSEADRAFFERIHGLRRDRRA